MLTLDLKQDLLVCLDKGLGGSHTKLPLIFLFASMFRITLSLGCSFLSYRLDSGVRGSFAHVQSSPHSSRIVWIRAFAVPSLMIKHL